MNLKISYRCGKAVEAPGSGDRHLWAHRHGQGHQLAVLLLFAVVKHDLAFKEGNFLKNQVGSGYKSQRLQKREDPKLNLLNESVIHSTNTHHLANIF